MAGSSTIEELPSQHQVFVSLSWAKTAYGFVSHLDRDLESNNIQVFIGIGQHLDVILGKIEESRIALVIFSEEYTKSMWCLRELEKIADCVEKGKLVAIPIFYKLDPFTVKGLKGEFGDAFWDLRESDATKERWKKALKSIAYREGIIVDQNRNESKNLETIVVEVKRVMNQISSEGNQEATFGIKQRLLNVPKRECTKTRAKPESSSSYAKTNADFLDRTCTNSPMSGKLKPPKIQVFINFRGVQLRKYFISYLADALRKSGINVFIDTKANIGDDLINLFKRIEDSGIAIVVFSSRYTESEWCLNELVKIKERSHQGLLKVLPIFYKVTPGNVKRLKGDFGDNFRDKEYMYASDEPKIKRWKEAIVFVSHKFALTFDEKSSVLEIDFIETIVKEVLKMLQAISTVESGQSSR